MDTYSNKQNNSYHLWSDAQKKERTINKLKPPHILKILPNGRIIYKFYTGVRDTVSLNGNDTGSFLVSTQREKM